MAKWEVKRLFSQEFKRCNGNKRELWETFLYSLLENSIISERPFASVGTLINEGIAF